MRLYFAYGSNMNPAHMAKLCRGAEALGVATAENNIYYIAAAGYASIAPRKNARVYGVLWKIEARHIAKLDAYESVESELYGPAAIPVRHNGKLLRAMIYYALDTKPGRSLPGYQENVVAAAQAWRFPPDYLVHLEKFLPRARGEY
jgi:gamma-glutamylcyclotransferase (GGCT)/AIG2-like uncharacterized protein YtfP